jgi:outer membrane receptor for ferrienterochelin and colicin
MSIKNHLFIMLFVLPTAISAKNYTISGIITDRESGETLIGASVFDRSSKKGTASNAYGFYSLTLAEGDVSPVYSYVGYANTNMNFLLSKDTVINIALERGTTLDEVIIVARRTDIGVKGTQMSAIEVPIEQIKNIPAIFGEVDVIKALQLLPGVQSGTEGSAGFYVRGGGPDENLILLDEIPVYNANHALGFFSVFNADALKSVTLYKGSFPARFGERLSSVIDIRMKDGDRNSYHGNISVGLISSKFNIEGPVNKKTTFSLSARRTYFDILSQPVIKWMARKKGGSASAGYYFYDLNAKLNHELSDRDRLYLSFYLGNDAVYTSTKDEYMREISSDDDSPHKLVTDRNYMKTNWKWGNLITALRWNHIINNKLFMNTTAAFTRYRFYLDMLSEKQEIYRESARTETNRNSISYHSGINDVLFKSDFDYKPAPSHEIRFGLNYNYHTFQPEVMAAEEKTTGNSDATGNPINFATGSPPIFAHEMALYAEDDVSVSDMFRINAGLRYSGLLVQKRFYKSLQPRLAIRALVSGNVSVKAGYSYMSQYIHLLSNSSLSLPTDLWVPVTKRIEPMNTHQVSLGGFYNWNNLIDFSAEVYYKTMNNVIEYKDGASFSGVSTGWEDKVNMGRGWSYGLELLAQKSVGKTTGWVGYTWSKSERRFDRKGQEINFGRPFPAKYDRRHDFNVTLSHKFSERFDIGATWIYSTGNTGTLALQEYRPAEGGPSSVPYYESRNNFRMPDYHRLDAGFNFHKKTKHGIRTWNVGIYNVYNRLNPFLVTADTEYAERTGAKNKKTLKQISIFPIIPSVSYIYKF